MGTIEKKTVIDQIEIRSGGVVQVRFGKQVIEDGSILHQEWHRTIFLPDTDIDNQMKVVNLHLKSMGEALVSDDDIGKIRDHCELARRQ